MTLMNLKNEKLVTLSHLQWHAVYTAFRSEAVHVKVTVENGLLLRENSAVHVSFLHSINLTLISVILCKQNLEFDWCHSLASADISVSDITSSSLTVRWNSHQDYHDCNFFGYRAKAIASDPSSNAPNGSCVRTLRQVPYCVITGLQSWTNYDITVVVLGSSADQEGQESPSITVSTSEFLMTLHQKE